MLEIPQLAIFGVSKNIVRVIPRIYSYSAPYLHLYLLNWNNSLYVTLVSPQSNLEKFTFNVASGPIKNTFHIIQKPPTCQRNSQMWQVR